MSVQAMCKTGFNTGPPHPCSRSSCGKIDHAGKQGFVSVAANVASGGQNVDEIALEQLRKATVM